jgi:protein-tyrosine phosphatase
LLAKHGKEMADSVYQAYIADERFIRSAWEAMGKDYIAQKLEIREDEIEPFRSKVLLG